MSSNTDSLAPPAKKVLSDSAPVPMKMLGAKGVVPGAPPQDALFVVVALCDASDKKVQETAQQTIGQLPKPLLEGALGAELAEPVLAALGRHYANDVETVPKLLQQKNMTEGVLADMASRVDEAAGEIIATNEALLLNFPQAIEKLYMNKKVRMSTADRLVDLAVRNDIELDFPAFKQAAEAIRDQLIAEPTEEPTYSDMLFQKIDEAAEDAALQEGEDAYEVDDEGEEQVNEKAVPIYVQLQQASVTEKIRRAMLGNTTERLLLVRDTNRLVAEAAAKSPRLSENEAAQIASSRAVSDDVLRIIASNRDLMRNYQIKLKLVTNPRTPFTFAARLLPHLRQNDLRALSRNKNVPGAVVKAARQTLSKRSR